MRVFRERSLIIVVITCAQSELIMCSIRSNTDRDNNQFIYFLNKLSLDIQEHSPVNTATSSHHVNYHLVDILSLYRVVPVSISIPM
jgi:hypothetical protein